MEDSLDRLGISITPSLAADVVTSTCNSNGSSRRLLRFFSWCRRKSGGSGDGELGDEVFNLAVRAFARMKDPTAVEIAISDFQKEGRQLDRKTFAYVAEALVKLGRPEKAVTLFRDVEEKQRMQWRDAECEDCFSITAAVHALCAKGHARKALGILWHHKDKVKTKAEEHHLRCLTLHGWSVHGNAKEARRLMEEIKSSGYGPSLASYHDLLRCICKRNLKFNPSAIVPEATNVMTEMRSLGISPTTVSFNILLSCLGKTRRVKEACRIILSMMGGGEGEEAAPDSVSYYLVIRLLYLTERFGRGNKLLNRMIEDEDKGRLALRASVAFYHSLIGVLCGMEKMEHALKMFERMKRRCCCGRGEKNNSESYNFGPTYDLLVTKLCRNGKFDQGRLLWNEAVEQGITLQCSSDLVDPQKAPQVFNPPMRTPLKKKGGTNISKKGSKIKRRKGH